MHPIYAAFLNRPDLLAQHLQAYGDLVQIQTRVFGRALRLRLWATLLAWVSALLALIWGAWPVCWCCCSNGSMRRCGMRLRLPCCSGWSARCWRRARYRRKCCGS